MLLLFACFFWKTSTPIMVLKVELWLCIKDGISLFVCFFYLLTVTGTIPSLKLPT